MSATKRPPHVSESCLPGAGAPGVCDRCCKPLEGRRRRWCSDGCGRAYFDDHVFAWSRHRARERDNNRCTVPGCTLQGQWEGVEVDHIEAAEGRHGVHACVHHLDNLRSLCHEHHKERTRLQRRTPRVDLAQSVLAIGGAS